MPALQPIMENEPSEENETPDGGTFKREVMKDSSVVPVEPATANGLLDNGVFHLQKAPTMDDSRLARIAKGEKFPSEIHESLAKEEFDLEIDHFNLWYGAKQ